MTQSTPKGSKRALRMIAAAQISYQSRMINRKHQKEAVDRIARVGEDSGSDSDSGSGSGSGSVPGDMRRKPRTFSRPEYSKKRKQITDSLDRSDYATFS